MTSNTKRNKKTCAACQLRCFLSWKNSMTTLTIAAQRLVHERLSAVAFPKYFYTLFQKIRAE